jgi:hypothetical protein
VLEGIESNATQHAGSRVAETPRGPGVGALMHAKGKDQNNNLESDKNNLLAHNYSSLLNIV